MQCDLKDVGAYYCCARCRFAVAKLHQREKPDCVKGTEKDRSTGKND
jgi:hypothetical protein